MFDPTLRATDIVLAFVDLQEGIIGVGTTAETTRLRCAVGALADLALTFSLPVVVSSVATTSGTVAPTIAEIATRLPRVQPLLRTTADILDDAAVRASLAACGRRTIILAGVAVEVAVRLSALAALRDGFRAIVAVDACGGYDARTESAAFMHLCAAGTELSAVTTIAAQLAGDFHSETGRAAMRALQSALPPRVHHHESDHDR
jgi:nicotinamidase-related amidase